MKLSVNCAAVIIGLGLAFAAEAKQADYVCVTNGDSFVSKQEQKGDTFTTVRDGVQYFCRLLPYAPQPDVKIVSVPLWPHGSTSQIRVKASRAYQQRMQIWLDTVCPQDPKNVWCEANY